jgi:beta-glucanase (GH16 family)
LLAVITTTALGINANAATSVPKATKVTVSTAINSAKLSWAQFPSGKITAIQVTASTGSTKITKSLAAKSTSFSFKSLKSNTSYTFSVIAINGIKSSVAVSVKGATKKYLFYNSILFIQPQDMMVGDDDQPLLALPNGGITAFGTSTPAVCSIVNDTYLHAIKMGECILVASNPGDKDYAASSDEIRTLSIMASIGSLNKTLLWSDEFDGTAGTGPSAANWDVYSGDGCGSSAGCGFGNGESQAYAACANKADGQGSMIINSSTRAGNPSCTSNKSWTSGKFTSLGKKHFTYGYFESRMKMPSGGGTWPAFWTLGTNISTVPWPGCGELDIMEYAGNSPGRTTSAVHYGNSSGDHEYKSGQIESDTVLADSYHTYGLLWLPNELTFFFDGKIVTIVKKSDTGLTYWPFGSNSKGVPPKMYIIFNLAMGGNYGGTIDGNLKKATFGIDYVRYYSVDSYGVLSNN